VVAIGISDDSIFDFSYSVSPVSIETWDKLRTIGYGILGTFLIGCALYVVLSCFIRGIKEREHARFVEEREEEEEEEE
jgi:hypothetical protein